MHWHVVLETATMASLAGLKSIAMVSELGRYVAFRPRFRNRKPETLKARYH